MSRFLHLISAGLPLGLLGLTAFLQALRSVQFDDQDGAVKRIFCDDDNR